MRMSRPSASLAAKPQTPSQLDECGAPISTSLGTSGNSPTMRQPPRRSSVRPNHGPNRWRRTRGAFGGSGSTRSPAVSGMQSPSIPVARVAAPLDRTAFALGTEPALLRAAGRLGRDPRPGRMQAGFDEARQPLARILPVAILGAEALRADHEHALEGQPAIATGQQA